MPTRLLLVTASPRGEESESLRLAAALVDAFRDAGGGDVDTLDLFAEPLPPFATAQARAKMAVVGGETPPDTTADAWREVLGLLDGRRAVVLATSHVYAPGLPPGFGVDFHTSYLEHWLRMCGFGPVDVVRLQPTRPGAPDLGARREAALAQAAALGQELAR